MAEISAATVMALREKTGLPLMEVKKALKEAGGDEEKAVAILKDQFGKVMEKRSANPTEEGRIFVKVKADGSEGAMVEMQCESAPVAANEEFNALGNAMVTQLLEGPGAASVDELLDQTPAGAAESLRTSFEQIVNQIREKIVVARVARVAGPVGYYVHHDGKTAALFQAEGTVKDDAVLRDIAMHVAAIKPNVATVEDVDPAQAAAAREALVEEARQSGKPDNIIDKIVDGRMKVFYREEAGVLVEQAFAKDDSKTVSQVLAEHGLKAKGFTLWVLGA